MIFRILSSTAIQRHHFLSLWLVLVLLEHPPLCSLACLFISVAFSETVSRPWISTLALPSSTSTNIPPTFTPRPLSLYGSILLSSSWERLNNESSAPPRVKLLVCLSTISANFLSDSAQRLQNQAKTCRKHLCASLLPGKIGLTRSTLSTGQLLFSLFIWYWKGMGISLRSETSSFPQIPAHPLIPRYPCIKNVAFAWQFNWSSFLNTSGCLSNSVSPF